MSGQLIPPPGHEPRVSDDATPEQCIALWVDLMDAADQFLLAGLRREIGPEGDLKAAYREWYRNEMEDHFRTTCGMADEFNRRYRGDAG